MPQVVSSAFPIRISPLFESASDAIFDPNEFDKLVTVIGTKFSLDGASKATGENSLVPDNFCYAEGRPFQEEDLTGQHVFLNAPFQLLDEMLSHYCKEKERSPHNTSGCFVVPKWQGATFFKYLKGMQVVAHYAKGTKLFHAINHKSGKREPMPGIPWEVMVFYDPPRHPSRTPKQVHVHCMDVHGSGSLEEQTLSMKVKGALSGRSCAFFLDTMAKISFVNASFVRRAGMTVHPGAQYRVVAYDGHDNPSLGTVKCRMKMGGLREDITLNVLEMDEDLDVILGEDWLQSHKVDISFDRCVITAKSKGTRYVLPSSVDATPVSRVDEVPTDSAQQSSPVFLRSAQVKRFIRKRVDMFVVNVRSVTNPEDRTQVDPKDNVDWRGFPSDTQSPTLSGDHVVSESTMEQLLRDNKDVLGDLPPGLPPLRDTEHTIPLVPGSKPVFRPPYRLSPAEREEVEKQVKHLLEMGYITPSSSPYGSPILFVPKPNGKLRMCVDYRMLNDITIKNRYSMPRSDDLIDSLGGSKVFSALDLTSGYWQIRLAPGESEKTAFRTHFGHFEWKVLPFGLCNAPATFQSLVNRIFAEKGYLNKFCAVYLDDILVYSKSTEEHVEHLNKVFAVLREHKLYANPEKCQFNRSELNYLGHVIGKDGIKVDPRKIEVVKNYPTPANAKEVRSFIGLATYFRRFIQGFSALARPLHALTHKGAKWQWDTLRHNAFVALKEALVSAPVLAMPDWDKPFEVVCDASVHGVGAVILQENHPIAYESQKFHDAAYNYDTGEQELLAVVHALRKFRCYVEGKRFTLVTDHEPLTFLQGQPRLSRKLARWYEFLQSFDFEWKHRPGRINVADPLSRIPGLQGFVSCRIMHIGCLAMRVRACVTRRRSPRNHKTDLPVVDQRSNASITTNGDGSSPVHPDTGNRPFPPPPNGEPLPFLDRVKAAYARDIWFETTAPTDDSLVKENDLWWKLQKDGANALLVIPDGDGLRKECIRMCHDSLFGGHFGTTKTLHLVRRSFWWPKDLRPMVRDYVNTCQKCQEIKSPTHAPYGMLSSHRIPTRLWESISMDFVVKLPETERGNDAILVVVDRLSKYIICVACSEEGLTAPKLIRLLKENVFKYVGYPQHLVCDRDPRCTSHEFQNWAKQLSVDMAMNTAYHSRANGQTERFNLTLENYLRAFVEPNLTNWDELLPDAQLAINNSWQESIQNTPYFVNFGEHPWIPGLTFKQALRRSNPRGLDEDISKSDRLSLRRRWPKERAAVLSHARECIVRATERTKRQFDKSRNAIEFQVGDRVLLNTRNLKFKGLECRKLMPRFIGPFTIEERVGSVSYKLTLPDTMAVHPVFHVELLRPFRGDSVHPPPALICDDGTAYWEVDSIIAVRGSGDKRRYRVRWAGFGPEWDTWEPRKSLIEDAPEAVEEFEKRGVS